MYAGTVEDFHLLVIALCRAHTKKRVYPWIDPFCHAVVFFWKQSGLETDSPFGKGWQHEGPLMDTGGVITQGAGILLRNIPQRS